jgi:hypothetical protein
MAEKKSDKETLDRIRRDLNVPGACAKMVDGVHTWDVAAIFKDFRTVVQIARRALKANDNK